MSERLSTDPYKGVRDFYPNNWARFEAIFTRIRKVLSLWGYEEYNASPLERSELYETKTSEEIVNEQTYNFLDRGGRHVTLRPEMTPTLARMIAGKRRELAFPLRWFSVPNLFRYERPQKGRLREHYQLNVDLIGIDGDEADIEIIEIASEILKSFGAKEKDFVIRVNSRELLTAACKKVGLSDDETRAYLRLLDKKSKITSEEFEIARTTITNKDPLQLIESKKIEKFVSVLKERGVENAVFDSTLTRGFDYYTGIVFEVYDTNPENPRSLFGGGRFDKLISLFGGDSIPAVGFGMGDVTLSDFLETHKLIPSIDSGRPQLYIGTPDIKNISLAQELAKTLREQGCRVFVNLTDKPLGDQIKDAVRRNIPFFVAYGADEVNSKTVRIKILETSEEINLPESEISSRINLGS